MVDNKPSAARETLLKLAYETACESLAQQRADLRAIRAQAAVTAAVSGLVGTIFSRIAIEAANSNGNSMFSMNGAFLGALTSTGLALISFAGSILFSIRLLIPNDGWKFEDSPEVMISNLEYRGSSFDDIELYRKLALSKERRFEKNDIMINKVQSSVFFSACLAFIQIPFWIFTIIFTRGYQ